MNWLLDSPQGDIVGIKDELAISVMDVLDIPQGNFVFDPYADSRISAHRLSRLAENIRHAISELTEQRRRKIMKRLNLPEWPSWAQTVLDVETAKDPLLEALEKLSRLCAKAMELDCDIIVLGD